METLLATAVRPLEVMLGKIMPYVIVAYIQMTLTLIFATLLFNVPIKGSVSALFLSALPFIVANFFNDCKKSTLSYANGILFFLVFNVIVRVHVSIFRYAKMGTNNW